MLSFAPSAVTRSLLVSEVYLTYSRLFCKMIFIFALHQIYLTLIYRNNVCFSEKGVFAINSQKYYPFLVCADCLFHFHKSLNLKKPCFMLDSIDALNQDFIRINEANLSNFLYFFFIHFLQGMTDNAIFY